jgi:adenine/guanine/hypoxanthine permease
MDKNNISTTWVQKSDISGFFGLFTNSLTNSLAALGLLAFGISMPREIVFGRIAPALVIAIGLGNIYMSFMARKLSIKVKSDSITALPYGVSVPHYFAVAFTVILPIYVASKDWSLAWGVGAAWCFVQGLIMLVGAFIAPWLQKYIPRGALLGSLAGIAVTFIAMGPAGNVFGTPIVGLTSLAILIVGWLANKKLPFNIPVGLFAIIIGTILAWSIGFMDIVALQESFTNVGVSLPIPIVGSLLQGFKFLTPFLPAAIPLGIYDFLESLDNIESAHADGEPYNTLEAMLVPALLTIGTSFLGNPFPMIIYIGHPGWKATGARVGYSWMTGIAVMFAGFLGLLSVFSSLIPLVALLPILMYIATVIGKQAFSSVKSKYYPALILGFMPFIASYTVLQINNVLNSLGIDLAASETINAINSSGVPYYGFITLGSADILVSMLLITIVIFAIDKAFLKSAIYAIISGVLAIFGFIHSEHFTLIPNNIPPVSIGYFIMALIFILANFYNKDENINNED